MLRAHSRLPPHEGAPAAATRPLVSAIPIVRQAATERPRRAVRLAEGIARLRAAQRAKEASGTHAGGNCLCGECGRRARSGQAQFAITAALGPPLIHRRAAVPDVATSTEGQPSKSFATRCSVTDISSFPSPRVGRLGRRRLTRPSTPRAASRMRGRLSASVRHRSGYRLRAKLLPAAGTRVRSSPSALRCGTGSWSVGEGASELAAPER